MCIRCDLRRSYGELSFLEPGPFDYAILGVTHDGRVLYDQTACVDILIDLSEGETSREAAHKDINETAERCQFNHHKRSPAFAWIDWEILDRRDVDADEDEQVQ